MAAVAISDQIVQDKHYTREVVYLDDTVFINCVFDHCKLIFTGEGRVSFDRCRFIFCQWVFDGPAENSLRFLSALYRGLGSEGRELVKGIFESIERGTVDEGHLVPLDNRFSQ